MTHVEDMRIEWVPLSEIVRWPRNPKDHDLGLLSVSFRRWGFVKPLLLDERSGKLVAGHGRLDTLEMEMADGGDPPPGVRVGESEWEVPVIRGVSFDSEAEAEAFLVADNRTTEMGGWIEDRLAEILQEHAHNLSGTGFDTEDLDTLINDLEGEVETPEKPEIEISPELFERHDYVVFYFDNEFDWHRAMELFDLKTVQTAQVGGKTKEMGSQQRGIGRVVDGKRLLAMLEGVEPE